MTTTAADVTWYEANQQYLTAALAEVRSAIERYARMGSGAHVAESRAAPSAELDAAAVAMPTPSALESLCGAFGLTPFERDVLLLCAGVELDSGFAAACAAAQGEPAQSAPTFGLALAALREPHWSALVPEGPLRYRRLIDVASNSALTQSPLRIDERVLHYLAGVEQLDERLAGLIQPLRSAGVVVPSQRALVDRLVAAWSADGTETGGLPVVQLCGDDDAGKWAIAGAACAALGWSISVMPADVLPASPGEMEALVRLWERESILGARALLLDCADVELTDVARMHTILRFAERLETPLIVTSRERWRVPRRRLLTLDASRPDIGERRLLWEDALGSAAGSLNGRMDALVSQFGLDAAAIQQVSSDARSLITKEDGEELNRLLWESCRIQARPRLDELAQRIDATATIDDLVIPDELRLALRDIAAQVRQRLRVYETWGFAAKGSRGLGVSALFTGASGTGKTMAAEVLANELELDLYRIDLSQVINKYIGETEKNLRRVFDAAEEGGAILLFDEADALFGKRSEVKDSHDRYANIEVSYLLQRMEAYRGLAILTTNMKTALDNAFLRRIRFVLQFPFPDVAQRAEIWRRIFPRETPTEGLEPRHLARLTVAGGNIRNIALYAVFLAADASEPVRMCHLLHAARVEYAKLEKPLMDAEIRGWA
jgi:hypothetical protein